jgi:glycosyltransferase involved in cell wall biosynthesis
MRILFVADGRSPTAVTWIRYFVEQGHEVHLASSFPARVALKLASSRFIPVAFSGAASEEAGASEGLRGWLPTTPRTRLRQWLGPFTLRKSGKALRAYAEEVQPDLVHALRIPFEGMMAAQAGLTVPLIISVWGNDFTLHAPSTLPMQRATRRAMRLADGLHTDTQRDVKLATRWGFDANKPSIVLPGNGGIRPDLFYPMPHAEVPDEVEARLLVINPRGIRAYVRNDVFFQSIPHILRKRPEVRFLCPSMEGEPEAEKWVNELALQAYVQLMPKLSPKALADSYHSSQVMVSPSTHDGTPNTLLEAMACGCFPVVGDIESLREWITDGENGLLVNPNDPRALADAVVRALKDHGLRARAAALNKKIIQERALYEPNMQRAEQFYKDLAKV